MEKTRVLVTFAAGERQRAIIDDALGNESQVQYLKDTPEQERKTVLGSAQILYCWNVPKEVTPEELQLLHQARLIQLVSAGVDHLPFEALPHGVKIAANVGAYAEPMAEHILAMTLAMLKNILRQHAKLTRGEFDQKTLGRSLRGAVCGILGFGGIGEATARLLRPFGAKIYGINRSGRSREPADFLGNSADLGRVLRESDVVVICLPLNKSTRGLIGNAELATMKRDAILINVARADIVDEEALYQHLKSTPTFQAGIDAWWTEPFKYGEFRMRFPFLELPNVLGSPHNSALAVGATHEAARRGAENMLRFCRGEAISGVVRVEDYI